MFPTAWYLIAENVSSVAILTRYPKLTQHMLPRLLLNFQFLLNWVFTKVFIWLAFMQALQVRCIKDWITIFFQFSISMVWSAFIEIAYFGFGKCKHQYLSERPFLSVSAVAFSIKNNIKLAHRYSKTFNFSASNILSKLVLPRRWLFKIVLCENKKLLLLLSLLVFAKTNQLSFFYLLTKKVWICQRDSLLTWC